jgi:GNAT superfamily N-acetyltransferase
MAAWHREDFTLTDEQERMCFPDIVRLLRQSYWAKARPEDVIKKSCENSLVLSVLYEGKQVAVARVVTDYATFAWLCDVVVDEEYRGRGLGKWLVETAVSHDSLSGLRRWILATRDAPMLYREFGFAEMNPELIWMERLEEHPSNMP